MKNKILCLLLTVVMAILCTSTAFATETDSFTQSEAEDLFYDAFLLFHVYQYPSWFEDEAGMEVERTSDGNSMDNYFFVVNNVEYSANYISKIYIGNVTYDNLSLEKLKEIVGMYYEKVLIDDFMKGIYSSAPLFYQKEDTVHYIYIPEFGDPFFVYEIVDYTDFRVNGDTASITVILERGIDYENTMYLNATIKFVKTDDGWRLAHNPFTDDLYISNWRENAYDNPNTGDTTVTTAALLATIALAAVITPFALSKKRRAR